jgi:archaeosine synthase beta-subunit
VSTPTDYPSQPAERTRWILAQRPSRPPVDPRRPAGFFLEQEPDGQGRIAEVTTILLTNRECPWRCLMCDLWKHTTPDPVPSGAIPAQIDHALARLGQLGSHGLPSIRHATPETRQPSRQYTSQLRARMSRGSAGETLRAPLEGLPPGVSDRPPEPAPRHLKLYNAGSFFDARAIPPCDHPAIARRAAGFERVIVECHPALVGEPALRLRDLLEEAVGRVPVRRPGEPRLEVAMGLETVHPQVLPRLNKRMTLDQFRRAARFLERHEIALRVFVLVKPPFLSEEAALEWAGRSVEFAFDCGAAVVCLIPTRGGNGAMEALAARGQFAPPRLATLEAALERGLKLSRGRVLADLWDLESLSDCNSCFQQRADRLRRMNLAQKLLPRVEQVK